MLQTSMQCPRAGDTIVLHLSHIDMRPLKLVAGERLQCKSGTFDHDAMIKTPYGCRVTGRPQSKADMVMPQATVLRLTPELWSLVLKHRTQIIHFADISVIIMHLRLRPGCTVAEAGTGSGSLTHALARAVAPHGKVYTFDFHRQRADEARKEFAEHGLGDVVVSDWRDVCRPGPEIAAAVPTPAAAETQEQVGEEPEAETKAPPSSAEGDKEPPSGYGLPPLSMDAVFLDVPAPWLAVPNVLFVLRPGGGVCSYSPCIEQTQKLCAALRNCDEFLDLHTVEVVNREYAPVFPTAERRASAAAVGAKRDRPEGGAADAAPTPPPQPTARGDGIQLRPRPDGKGHSAYLTFARRRKYAPTS
jgi:tRNA (adenine57-N1/adenine58-N1)-methyltransferase